jgi:hypothetical protein
MAMTSAASSGSVVSRARKDWSIFKVSTRQTLQVAERRVAGAEIVDSYLDAHLFQLAERLHGRLRILMMELPSLQFEMARVEARL